MAPNTKRVFYVNNVSAPVYLEILAKRPDIHVDRLVNDSPNAEVEPVLAQAHAYQIGSSRQELVMKLQGYSPLLARCPNLLVLSTNGAGFDTVNLEDATAVGVAVVNQAGGNKEGVAEHVMVVSPHTAGITRQSRHNIARIAAEQMLDILDGKKPARLLNPEVWGAYRERFGRILGFRPEG
jgi:D-3-phosphoglycerate dehydrogenase